jgi:CTP:molybdopterin cytidylyltransferase MocA
VASVAGLVLAAGEGRRFGGPKAPVVIDGERLVDRAVRVLRAGGCDPIYVVLGAWVGDVPGAVTVTNPDWAEGMGSSLRAGLEAVEGAPVEAVVVTLVDLPGLTGEAVRRLVDVDSDLAAATYGGERGHPVRFGRRHWLEVAGSARGDAGARSYLSERADEIALVEVGDVATGEDLDEPL